jgi:hypothetical protein
MRQCSNTCDQEGVIAALSQLHLNVHQLGQRSLEVLHEKAVVVLENRAVVLFLWCCGEVMKK